MGASFLFLYLFFSLPLYLLITSLPAYYYSVRMPYISLLILTFLNRCISVKTSLISTKLGNLVNLGVLFLTSPSRFETRQWENKPTSSNSVFRGFSAVPVFRGALEGSGVFQSVSVFPSSGVPGFSTCHSFNHF